MAQTNIADRLEPGTEIIALCGLVMHSEHKPGLIYMVEKKPYTPGPLEEALVRDDYKHTPNGIY